MALKDLWKSSPEQLRDKHLPQIIAFAGSGKLRDGSTTSNELRDFLAIVPSNLLKGYTEDCLAESFTDSGLALQDVVNQIGRRLGYEVRDGRYRGKSGEIGFDGLWTSNDGHNIIVEVKTTDAYRIDLNTVADYRRKLANNDEIATEASSILIVVGREDTGDLEAQIRGSRYAWDVRLISVEALVRLMLLKEEVDDQQIIKRISDMLIPREFTKLDEIIELVFFTAEDARKDVVSEQPEIEEISPESVKKSTPVNFYEESVGVVQKHLTLSLVKQSKTVYATPDQNTTVLCIISKQYKEASRDSYWFAFHPHQRDLLVASERAFVAFGCGIAGKVILIPFAKFESWLEGLNQTIKEDKYYWHVYICESPGERITFERKRGFEAIDISAYLI